MDTSHLHTLLLVLVKHESASPARAGRCFARPCGSRTKLPDGARPRGAEDRRCAGRGLHNGPAVGRLGLAAGGRALRRRSRAARGAAPNAGQRPDTARRADVCGAHCAEPPGRAPARPGPGPSSSSMQASSSSRESGHVAAMPLEWMVPLQDLAKTVEQNYQQTNEMMAAMMHSIDQLKAQLLESRAQSPDGNDKGKQRAQ